MKAFKYQVSLHGNEEFSEIAYFCGPEGGCRPEAVPGSQLAKLADILNDRGRQGWEMVQVFFSRQGLAVFWKMEITGGD